ncbi:MAG: hypothetical protein HKP38_00650 [Croceitalea sp.]|nr:hypothetical protein [Croceitalea sp.]NNL07710.1 hypothetical protein [Croceitalea sp.]
MNRPLTSNQLDQLVIRLERNHQCILRMAKKLSSYRYEPKNYEGFIKLRELRMGFKALIDDHRLAFEALNRKALEKYEAHDRVNALLTRYQDLEKEMAAYILDLQYSP